MAVSFFSKHIPHLSTCLQLRCEILQVAAVLYLFSLEYFQRKFSFVNNGEVHQNPMPNVIDEQNYRCVEHLSIAISASCFVLWIFKKKESDKTKYKDQSFFLCLALY